MVSPIPIYKGKKLTVQEVMRLGTEIGLAKHSFEDTVKWQEDIWGMSSNQARQISRMIFDSNNRAIEKGAKQ